MTAKPVSLAPAVIPHPSDRANPSRHRVVAVGGIIAITLYILFLARLTALVPYDRWAGFFLAPLLFLAAVPFLNRFLQANEPDGWVRKAVIIGLAVKLLGAFARFYMNEYVIGHADASAYANIGAQLAAEFQSFVFGGPAFQRYITDFTGTRFIRLFTGLVFTVTGRTGLGGYVVFSFMSFFGLYLFYRAFCIAVPDGLRRRYVLMVFYLPSVVFWPSSIGKEAWMITMLGIGSYGLARLLAQERYGYLTVIIGLTGMGIVRPHVAAIFGVGAASAFLLRSNKGGTGKKLLGLLVFAAIAGVLINQMQSFFDLGASFDPNAVLEETTRRSSQGGSEFQPVNPTSPTQFPWAVVTVLFRPFLYEAGGGAGMITALEGTILLALFVWNLPRLVRLPTMMVRRPYVAHAIMYTVAFVLAFSAIANFGILARQRTQLYPIATVALAMPYATSRRTRKEFAKRREQMLAGGEVPALEVVGATGNPQSQPTAPRYTGYNMTPRPAAWPPTQRGSSTSETTGADAGALPVSPRQRVGPAAGRGGG